MSDDFSTRYRLLKCVLVEDGIRTHNAQEVASGKVVMVHISDAAGPDEVESLRTQMAALDMIQKRQILETATLPSGFAVVTEFLPGSPSFGSWLAKHAVARETVAPPDVAPATADPTLPPAPPQDNTLGSLTLGALPPGQAVSDTQSGGLASTGMGLKDVASQDTPSPPPATPLGGSPGAADSFTALFGTPKDPGELDDGVREVKTGMGSRVGFPLDGSAANDLRLSPVSGAPIDPPSPLLGLPTPIPAVTPPPPAPASASAPTAAPAFAPPPSPPAAPGEFTMMFSPDAAAMAAHRTASPVPTPAPSLASVPGSKAPTVPNTPVLDVPDFGPPAAHVSELTPPKIPPFPVQESVTSETPRPVAPLVPEPSPFAWDAAPEAAPVAKAPPGEFTMMFGAPATAAPMPEQVRPFPMREAPPPTFSPLTPGAQLESPPVEPMHRVMSSNPSYAAGIQQEGLSPISNNLGSGYAGSLSNRYPQGPGATPSSSAAYSSQNAGARYSGMPEFNPAPTPVAYSPAHASPLTTPQSGPNDPARPGGVPGILPPPIFGNGGSTPLSALGGAASIVNASAGPSEYTQLIAHGAAPVVPELKPAAFAAGEAKRGGRRLPTGLIVVINAILLIAALLLFFVFKQQIPTAQTVVPRGPVMPNVPKAPQLPK